MYELKLADNLRELRITNGYTRKYISQCIHIARQTYSSYEKGKTPSLDAVCSLAEFYHVPVDLLLFIDLSEELSDASASTYKSGAVQRVSFSLNGADARMLTNYKALPPDDQQEAREYMLFKKRRWQAKMRGGDS